LWTLFGYFCLLLFTTGVQINNILDYFYSYTGENLSDFSNLFDILCASVVPIKIYPNADISKQEIIKDNKNKSGIYRWVNNTNGKAYVGSGKNLSNRLVRYYSYKTLTGKRYTMLIHRALLKYGYSNFSLEILEYCTVDELMAKEQHYLDLLKPEYNILKKAYSSIGFKHSPKTLEILRQIQLKIHESVDHITKKVLANSNSIKIQLTDIKTNEVFLFNSIRDAARGFAIKEGRSVHTIRGSMAKSIKRKSLYLDRYKITKINSKK
jgi:excinuclease UvrABC nuclease subunit